MHVRSAVVARMGELWRRIADKNQKSDVLHCAEDGKGYEGWEQSVLNISC
jgi:hypothetical protein